MNIIFRFTDKLKLSLGKVDTLTDFKKICLLRVCVDEVRHQT